MNVFVAELRAHRKSTVIWVTALCSVAVVFLLIFPAFTKDVEASRKVLENFPPAIRAAFGLSLETLFTVYGFFAYLFTFISLIGAIQACNLGVGALSRETAAKTMDFLLSKPVSRARVLTSKVAAVAVLLVATNVVFSVVTLVAARIVSPSPVSADTFLMLTGGLLIVQVAFAAIGILLSVVVRRVKSTVAVTLPTVFAFYVVGLLDAIIGNQNIRYVTPFKYVDLIYVIEHQAYEARYLVVEAVIVVLAVAGAYSVFSRKDLQATA